jgi:hypothetical protein
VLAFAVFGLFLRVPADRRRIEQDLRALHGVSRAPFRVPLVPADQHADPAEPVCQARNPSVAGGEIELLVVQRIIRDVHLPVDAEQRAVGVDDRGGVVVEPGPAARTAKRSPPRRAASRSAWNASVLGPGIDSGKRTGRDPRSGRSTGAKQLLGADDVRARLGRLFRQRERLLQIWPRALPRHTRAAGARG